MVTTLDKEAHAAAIREAVLAGYSHVVSDSTRLCQVIMKATDGIVTKQRVGRARQALKEFRDYKCGLTLACVLAYVMYCRKAQPVDRSVAVAASEVCAGIMDALDVRDRIILEECLRCEA